MHCTTGGGRTPSAKSSTPTHTKSSWHRPARTSSSPPCCRAPPSGERGLRSCCQCWLRLQASATASASGTGVGVSSALACTRAAHAARPNHTHLHAWLPAAPSSSASCWRMCACPIPLSAFLRRPANVLTPTKRCLRGDGVLRFAAGPLPLFLLPHPARPSIPPPPLCRLPTLQAATPMRMGAVPPSRCGQLR